MFQFGVCYTLTRRSLVVVPSNLRWRNVMSITLLSESVVLDFDMPVLGNCLDVFRPAVLDTRCDFLGQLTEYLPSNLGRRPVSYFHDRLDRHGSTPLLAEYLPWL